MIGDWNHDDLTGQFEVQFQSPVSAVVDPPAVQELLCQFARLEFALCC